jgi:formamidopyrimidine-DNA glycosylase
MPELPEIEVLQRSLEPLLVGERIEGVRVRNPALREPVDRTRLGRRVRGRGIRRLRRRAKYLLIDLEGGNTLVVHLGMSGRLTLVGGNDPVQPHEHVAFRLAGGGRLAFRDPRRFGLVLALATAGLEHDRHFASLGIEPLGDELSGDALAGFARNRRGPVKSFLMDGRLIVGVGNIYASEALHRAAVHPRRSVARISIDRWCRLADAVRATLHQAIAEGGTTLNDFADGEGRSGYFQVSLRAYGREGEPCPRCDRAIRRLILGGRSTFYCPGCQR